MTQDEVIKLAAEAGFKWPDICETTIEQRLWRFANLIAVAEREKCTGTQEFVTLPREVVEQALEALINEGEFRKLIKPLIEKSIDSIRAALDQPKNHIEHHLGMVPAGWKLVPVEPTREMIEAGKDAHYEAEKRIKEPGAWEQGGFAKRAVRAAHVFQAMLAAAPQPPTVKECLTVEQPQANQPAMTPIAQRKLDSLLAEGYTISGYSVYHEQKHQHGFVTGAGLVGWWKPEGVEYPQPKGEQEPDWSDSKTLPSELWKNPLLSLQERLQIADGAVQWNREVAENLRARMRAAQQPQGEQEPASVAKIIGMDEFGPMLLWHRAWTDFPVGTKLYTHPQPKREPLTDEQIGALARNVPSGYNGFAQQALHDFRAFARAIERAHNIK